MFKLIKNKYFTRFLLVAFLILPGMDAAGFNRDWNIASGDLDGNKQDDVIVNFGQSGIWAWMNNTSWVQLHTQASKSFVTGDFDGNGKSDLVVDFSPNGIWIWMNNQSWVKLHDAATNYMVANDIDHNGKSDLVISFAPGGVWLWANSKDWIKLHDATAQGIAVGDIDGQAFNDIILNFGQNGIWIWRYIRNADGSIGALWDGSFKNFKTTLEMTTWKNDPAVVEALVLDIFGLGVYEYFYTASGSYSSPVKIHNLSPTQIKASDIDGNGIDELIYNFASPNGLWSLSSLGSWTKLHDLSAGDIAAADMDGNGKKDIIVDFLENGLWVYMNNSTWIKLHPGSPTLLNTPPYGGGVKPRNDVCLVKLNLPSIPSYMPIGKVAYIQVSSTYSCGTPTYSLTNPPIGMTIDPNSGLIQWNVPNTPGTNYVITINANDGQGGSDTLQFTLSWRPA